MKIRQLNPPDVNTAATISAAAWIDSAPDEYLYPGRHKHPKAFHDIYVRSLKNELLDEDDAFGIVAETEPLDEPWTGKAELVGYASWERYEKDDRKSLVDRLHERVLDTKENIYTLLNPAASLPRSLSYDNAQPEYFDEFIKLLDKGWTLAILSVDPRCQKTGIGLLLTRSILEKAEEQKIPVTLFSTNEGKRLHLKAGFKEIGIWKWGKSDGQSMATMRWDPPVLGEKAS